MAKRKCYIYTRVSTAAQIDGYSLEAQARRLHDYASLKNLEIAGEYCDAGKSGGSIRGRPEFQHMLDDIVSLKDEVSLVLVFKLSRFGRNAADVLKSMQLLIDYEVDLVCVEDGIDSSTQSGRLTLSILSAVAEIEKDNITVQFMAGKMQRVMNGEWPGGPAPFGYRIVDKKLIPEPQEAEIVRLMYRLYLLEEMSVNGICIRINELGYRKTVRGGERPFTRDDVFRILKNPVYCGKIVFGRRSEPKPDGTKKDVITVDGIHEAFVSKDDWDAVQLRLHSSGGRNKKTVDPDRVSLLSGLVRCPMCGSGLISIRRRKANPYHGGYYDTYYSYGCRNHRLSNGRSCAFAHTYTQTKLDAAVFEVISNLTQTEKFKAEIISQLGNQDQAEDLEKEMKAIRKQIRSHEVRARKLGAHLDALDILMDGYDAQYDRIQSEIDAVYDDIEKLETELEQKKRQLTALRRGINAGDHITELLDNIFHVYEHMSGEEKKEMYRLLIDRIEVYPEHPDGRIIKSIAFKIPVSFGETNEGSGRRQDETFQFTLDCSQKQMTAAESKATYAQIKAYILENCELKVTNLYIAQVKQECGIIERANYNLPKTEGNRVPQCPPEKREAILEALRHFRMIEENTLETEGDKCGCTA